jgi:hypothetical protein
MGEEGPGLVAGMHQDLDARPQCLVAAEGLAEIGGGSPGGFPMAS